MKNAGTHIALCILGTLILLAGGSVFGDEWHNYTAPGWAAVSIVKMGPDGALWLHGGSSSMSGLLRATARDGLLNFQHFSPYNSLCIPNAICDIQPSLDGLWLATAESLHLYRGIYSITHTPDNSPLPVNTVRKLCAGPDGGLRAGRTRRCACSMTGSG
ncbi:hypothetical protein J7M28_09400 [bacterium]|nr:hypothetical protein [bacterium]